MGFPGGSDGTESARNAGDPRFNPWVGKTPGEGNGNPLQYSCLENSLDRGAWRATAHEHTKSWTQPSNFHFFFFFLRMNKVYFQGKFGLGIQNEEGQRLIEFCQENALIIANTLFQQHKRRLYTWTSPDGQHRNQIDYILCSQRWRSSIQSTKTGPGADGGSDHELLIAKFRLKLKKVGKTTQV